MDVETWRSDEKTIEKSKKTYAHFDCRTSIADQKEYVTNPRLVTKHSFYPFIQYKKEYWRYHKKSGKVKKERIICYASHRDSCIFQYYSFLINEAYNRTVARQGLNEVAVAYRTNLGCSNIDLAKRAIDYIRQTDSCTVMIGDFTGFFDNLDHFYLKKQLEILLEVKRLPRDYYAVFKNVTKYSAWELSSLLELNQHPLSRKGRNEFNKRKQALSSAEFSKNRGLIRKNLNPYGIPQGSPISAVLANVYMLTVDKEINDLVQGYGGLYMRYSDDFIIVLPKSSDACVNTTFSTIHNILNQTPGLQLEPKKHNFLSVIQIKL